ncbi:hypothetical protein AMAG_13633 [Allomyces macrogynus ATCC 38327]|uniref:Uncharacterized protein n=1 Tax=Allomyces macrogynus (strain ATCC 38327) TaxID=578462 RepID=A0A0L0T3I4_ALLM3|nr:hypothetical protein AMAG_13633 [Allomyces macrogynus ATCC 38327]|eukprot:KNE69250.1 hypothetical protein AMAG_13633 [Allomyces macrogynus ATCC 38327]
MPHCTPVAASHAGRTDLLAIRKRLGLVLTEPAVPNFRPSICSSALAAATRHGHLAVFDWWFHESKVDLNFPDTILRHASVLESQADDSAVLEWWFKSGLLNPSRHGEKMTVHTCLTVASQKGHVRILECWRSLGLAFIWSEFSANLDAASFAGQVHILDWWVASGLPFRYTKDALKLATRFGQIAVLDWWTKSGLRWEVPDDLGQVIIHSRSKAVVQWWEAHGYCPQLSDADLAEAAREEDFEVLNAQALAQSRENGHIDVVKWRKESGLLL